MLKNEENNCMLLVRKSLQNVPLHFIFLLFASTTVLAVKKMGKIKTFLSKNKTKQNKNTMCVHAKMYANISDFFLSFASL